MGGIVGVTALAIGTAYFVRRRRAAAAADREARLEATNPGFNPLRGGIAMASIQLAGGHGGKPADPQLTEIVQQTGGWWWRSRW